MACLTATEQNNETFAHEKAFKAKLDFTQDKVVNQKEMLQFSTLCLLYTQELNRNGFPNPDYKSDKKNLESHPIHEQIAHGYVKHCGSVFCGLIHSSEISVADAVTYAPKDYNARIQRQVSGSGSAPPVGNPDLSHHHSLPQMKTLKSYSMMKAFPSDLVKFLRFLIAGETDITDSEKTIDIVSSIGQV